MGFNAALNGLLASSNDLTVTSNNIANASTTGFKESRAEFKDLYASTVYGTPTNAIGAGVTVGAISQQFKQGDIEFTNNNLDLAINGNGFFVLKDNGSVTYTRSGDFGVDKDGYLVNNLKARLQGYISDSTGIITGAQGDMHLSNANLAPRLTSNIAIKVNFDASSVPPTSAFSSGFTPTNPPNPNSFNTTVSTTIYDSLGNSHIVTNYFVKTPQENVWQVHMGIDGVDVTPTAASIPSGVAPVNYATGELPAPYTLVFDNTGAYVPNDPLVLPVYYGAGPIVSSAPGFVTAGSLNPIALNDLRINNVAIMPSLASSDTLSSSDNSASAIAMAAAINKITKTHGVTATPVATAVDLGIATMGTGVLGSTTTSGVTTYDLSINGVGIAGTFATDTALMNAINLLSSSTGVVASLPGGTGTALTLSAADGRNIQVTNTLAAASGGPTFANFSTTGGALDRVGRGTLSLAASNNQAITITGNNTLNAGLINSTLPQAGIYQTSSDVVNIENWLPSGGGAGPQPLLVDFSSTTQFGASFAVFNLTQDGYSTGGLSEINIDSTGVIVANYTNGETLQLGQVILANFNNTQALNPGGNTSWIETFASGSPIFGSPGSANLGVLQSGALEGSNVDLTNQLVNLILAQRNFQANAQSIKATDAITQTIIGIR